jgi:hypothetical protein
MDRTTGVDSETGSEVGLFNPRKNHWEVHFRWADDFGTLSGRTAEGRATIAALDMNNDIRLGARQLWFATGWLP